MRKLGNKSIKGPLNFAFKNTVKVYVRHIILKSERENHSKLCATDGKYFESDFARYAAPRYLSNFLEVYFSGTFSV